MAKKRRNKHTLDSFVKYCKANPDQRFWQALRNWSGNEFVLVRNGNFKGELTVDTFYFEGK